MAKPGYSTIRTPLMEELKALSSQINKPVSNLVEEALSLFLSRKVTYKAYYESTGQVIYSNKQIGDLYHSLPSGVWPIKLGEDIKDPYNGARFSVKGSNDFIIIEREK